MWEDHPCAGLGLSLGRSQSGFREANEAQAQHTRTGSEGRSDVGTAEREQSWWEPWYKQVLRLNEKVRVPEERAGG